MPPHTPDGGLTPDGERHPEITVPPHTPDGGLLPTPAGAPGTSAPIAALGRLLLRVQYLGAVGEDAGGVQHDALLGLGVGDPALPAAGFPPLCLRSLLLQEALPYTEPRVASSLRQGRGRGWIS